MTRNSTNLVLLFLSILGVFQLVSCESLEEETSSSKWGSQLIKAYTALHQQRDLHAARLLFDATEGMPNKNWENYFMTAIIYAASGKQDTAFLSLERAASYGLRDTMLMAHYPDLESLRADSRFRKLQATIAEAKVAYTSKIENPNLLKELEEMWQADQQALAVYNKNSQLLDSSATYEDYDQLFEPVEKRWEINKNKLDSIIAIYGWPTKQLVGEDGVKIAWAIPQHHPNVFYKEKCLTLIKASAEKGEINPEYYAELYDRIARDTWQKQTYGASMNKTAPYPIENPSEVNERRLALKLAEPIEVYAFYHDILYTVPTAEEAKQAAKVLHQEAQVAYTKFEEFAAANMVDSARVYLLKAIDFHGEISNQQLYSAALTLVQLVDQHAARSVLKLLKVLVWRRAEERLKIKNQEEFKALHSHKDWEMLEVLLEQSRNNLY